MNKIAGKHTAILLICICLIGVIGCATAAPELPDSADKEPVQIQVAAVSELAQAIDAYLIEQETENQFSGAVIVTEDDQITLSKGYGFADPEAEIPFTPDTRHPLGETSKLITILTVMVLENEGKLNFADPICDYLSDCPDIWADVTIHHLLSDRSAIFPYNVASTFMTTTAYEPNTIDTLLAPARERELRVEPGSSYRENDTNCLLAGLIVEAVSDMPLGDAIAQAVFEPLGMSNSGHMSNPENVTQIYLGDSPAKAFDYGNFFGCADLYSTANDLLLFEQAIEGSTLLPAEKMAAMLEPYSINQYSTDIGYGWYMPINRNEAMPDHAYGLWNRVAYSQISSYEQFNANVIRTSNQQLTSWVDNIVLGPDEIVPEFKLNQ